MLERMKLHFLRWLVALLMAHKWKGKSATDVDVTPLMIESGSTRVAARLYKPQSAKGPLPVTLYFHGGGWVAWSVATHDPICRDLCSRSGHMIISVDYRLAPEHPFPAGVNDCLGALNWLEANVSKLGGDRDRIQVSGDSAGGNLAAVVALQARSSHPGLIKGQVLIYPVIEHCSAQGQWPSYKLYSGKGYGLTDKSMKDLWRLYTNDSPLWKDGQTSHDLATPYRVTDVSGLPRTLLVLAEEDVLRDEGLGYGQRLSDAGADVQVKRYPSQKHGFVGSEPSAAYQQAINDIATWLKAAS